MPSTVTDIRDIAVGGHDRASSCFHRTSRRTTRPKKIIIRARASERERAQEITT